MAPEAGEKKPVKIVVCGQSFTVLAPGDPAETVKLSAEVDEIMTRIAVRSGHSDSARAAILTCLHLADRVRTLEREMEDIRQRIEDKAHRIAEILDQVSEPAREAE